MLVARDDGFQISDEDSRLDVELIHRWLSKDAYWALGRSRETVERSIAGSVNYGLYAPDGAQIGFARVVTDRATFAWLCDVYLDPAVRGDGLGTWFVGVVCDQMRGWALRRIVLATNDAHDLYAKFGFTPMTEPQRWMELRPAP